MPLRFKAALFAVVFLGGAVIVVFAPSWPEPGVLWMLVRGVLWFSFCAAMMHRVFRCPRCNQTVDLRFSGSPSLTRCARCGTQL